MKQLSAIFLVLAMVLALTACGKDDDRNTAAAAAGRTAPTRPPSPAPEKTGEMGRIRCPARRRRDVWTAASCAAARSAPPPSARCWKTAMSTTATASSTTAKTPAGNIFRKNSGSFRKKCRWAQGKHIFRPVPTCIFEKMGYDMGERICAAAGGREKKGLL